MKLIQTLVATLATVVALPAAAATVGGFDAARTLSSNYNIFAANGANAELNDAGNYAGYGDTITFGASTNVVDAAYLADIDIFFTGLAFNAQALAAAEVTALTDFINGGGVVIAHGDNTSFSETNDALLNNFGLDIDNTANNGFQAQNLVVDSPMHPIMSGPFGNVGSISISDSAFLLNATDNGLNIASYTSGEGAIGVSGPTAGQLGALIFLPDSETFGLGELGFRGQADAELLFNNAIAYAVNLPDVPPAVPLPAGMVLGLTGLLAFGALKARRKA